MQRLHIVAFDFGLWVLWLLMSEPVSLSVVLGLFALFGGGAIFLYRFANKKIMEKMLGLKRKNEDMGQVIERLYQARLNDNRELRSRLDKLEDRIDALARPSGREKEVALERVFARRR